MSKTIKINTTPCPDSTVTLNGESFVSVPSGGSEDILLVDKLSNIITPESTINNTVVIDLENDPAEIDLNSQFLIPAPSGSTVGISIVRQGGVLLMLNDNGSNVFEVPNAGVIINNSEGVTQQVLSIPPDVTPTYTALDGDVQINGVDETSVPSGGSVNITTVDQDDNVLTPVITPSGNDLELKFDVGGGGSFPSVGATLMKTGQTTSYATGDDGDIQAGRDDSFFDLPFVPVMADGSPTINTTLNRFTDELGGQSYSNIITIDWSTFDNVNNTVLGYAYGLDLDQLRNFNNAVGYISTFTRASFSNWRLTNRSELNNLINIEYSPCFNWPPFNRTNPFFISCSTVKSTPSNCYFVQSSIANLYSAAKTATGVQFAVRTFTVNGINPLT